jgi:hypothetical protein
MMVSNYESIEDERLKRGMVIAFENAIWNFAFDNGDLCAMSELIERRGDTGGTIKDMIPVFKATVGCD